MSFSILYVLNKKEGEKRRKKTGGGSVLVTTSNPKGLVNLTRHLYFNITKK